MTHVTTGTPPRRRTSRVAALLAAPTVAVCLLSGCSADQKAQTSRMVAPVAGNEANSRPHGQAALRDVQIRFDHPQGYPAGASAPLSLFITNNSALKPLVLRGVTAVNGRSGATLGTVVLVGGAPDIGAGGPSATAIPSTDPSEADEPASPAAVSPAGLTIPPNGYARLDVGHGTYLAVRDLTEALGPGSTAHVTFMFEGEEPLTVAVPFGVPLSPPPPRGHDPGPTRRSGAR
ncbi:hypothetical protein ACNTMW_31975 [Planosporangium sp. 12N6]|uniref:hypothetical protein n=1 Tax=Planosporangium spinosum TaxID=3402278 RepID=UPI003CEB1FB6